MGTNLEFRFNDFFVFTCCMNGCVVCIYFGICFIKIDYRLASRVSNVIFSVIRAWQQHAVCADIVSLHNDNSPMQGELKSNLFLDKFLRCKIFCVRGHGITVMILSLDI